MDEFVPVFILLVIFGFVMAVVKMNLDHKEKMLARGGDDAAGRSLGTSELKALLHEVVSESIAPVEDRLERVERSLRRVERRRTDAALPPRHEQALLDDVTGPDDDDERLA